MTMWSFIGAIALSVSTSVPVNPQLIRVPLSLISSLSSPTILAAETAEPTDTVAEQSVQNLLLSLQKYGYNRSSQGVWIQSNNGVMLAGHNATKPIAAASLTKIPTTLAALETWGANYQFVTKVSTTGKIVGNVLQGDLIVQGSGDPLFVWEEAISLGNAINRLGINRIEGNLVITGAFYMNFETSPGITAGFFRRAINSSAWTKEILSQYQTIKSRIPAPKVIITGKSIFQPQPNLNSTPLIAHSSLPLWQILKRMNTFSNNDMADMLANSLGGGNAIARRVQTSTGLSGNEIRLINGSGLGQQNQISPRASVGMLMAIQNFAQVNGLSLADLFPMSECRCGTIANRKLPPGTIVKTGTLSDVSSLAGIVQTRDRGIIWFAILNRGDGDIDIFHRLQDQVVSTLSQKWGVKSKSSFVEANFTPIPWQDTDRDQLLFKP